MYIMSCTRPDIVYVVSKLSRYTSNLGQDHWKAILRLLGYLKHTKNYGLHYTRYPAVLEGLVMLIGYLVLKTPNDEWLYLYSWRWGCDLDMFQTNVYSTIHNEI